jgi:hypothetical protein
MTMWRKSAGVRLAVVLGLVASLLSAGPAAASVPGLVTITAQSATNSTDPKSVTAICPASSPVLLSAGFENGGLGDVLVDDVELTAGSVTVVAYETDPDYVPNWRLTVYAVCSDPLPGLTRFRSEAAFESPDYASLTATCPAGDVLLSGGYELTGNGEVEVDDFRPNGDADTAPTAILVGAYETDPPYASNWRLTTYATCADPVPGLVRRQASSPVGALDLKEVTVPCEQGEVLVGSGYELNGSTGEVVIEAIEIDGDAGTPPTTVEVDAFREDGFEGSWTLTVYALCATA